MNFQLNDQLLVDGAVAEAKAADHDLHDEFQVLCLQAIASQQSAQRQHELAAQARAQAGALAAAGLEVLRFIFAAAVIA